jgi:putative transcriptional regulator
MTNHELRAARKQLNLTVKEMANKLNTPVRTYEGWEQGRTMPGIVEVTIKIILEFNNDTIR